MVTPKCSHIDLVGRILDKPLMQASMTNIGYFYGTASYPCRLGFAVTYIFNKKCLQHVQLEPETFLFFWKGQTLISHFGFKGEGIQ